MADDLRAWRDADAAAMAGDETTLARILRENAGLIAGPRPSATPGVFHPDYGLGDARACIVAWHQAADWDGVLALVAAAREPGSPVARFEAAVDATVGGDEDALLRAVRADQGLVRARSIRRHRATLLHYIGANGVEGWRQRSPANAAAMARILLDAGAEVDALAEIYGRDTTLGLVATSIFPLRAGVLDEVIALLIERGASVDGPPGSAPLVNGCLANGRRRGAELLAARGARLDIEGAAGVGRLDLVRGFFSGDQALATPEQVLRSFAWACEFGRTDVAEFLLDRGVDLAARLPNHGQTGLHWAAHGGHVDLVRMLLARGAPVDLPDPTWSGSPLSWALHGWSEAGSDAERAGHPAVVRLLISAGAKVQPAWRERPEVRSDAAMHSALALAP